MKEDLTERVIFSLRNGISDSDLIRKTILGIVESCQSEFGRDKVKGGQIWPNPNPDKDWQSEKLAYVRTTQDLRYEVGDYLKNYRIQDKRVVSKNIQFSSRR